MTNRPTAEAKMWLLVADQGRARLFGADSARGPLQEFRDAIEASGRARNQDLVTDRPGRSFDSGGHGRHAMEPSTDPVEHEAVGFAKRLAAQLDEGRLADCYQHLGLIAPPAFLGHLRKSLSKETARRVVIELDKDLSRDDASSLREHLPERLFDELG